MLILKFGGASLSDASGFSLCLSWFKKIAHQPSVFVVSALYGVTNHLLELIRFAEGTQSGDLQEGITRLKIRHFEIVQKLDIKTEELQQALDIEFLALESLLQSACVLAEVSPRARDRILSYGERLSSLMVAMYLGAKGALTQRVLGEEVIVTEARFGNAIPMLIETGREARRVLQPLLDNGVVPVVAGFTGRTPNGQTTTLGRGGTDLSASVLARALGAKEVWYLKETDGILSADPKLMPSARLIPRLSYSEMAELSYFGAKVIHPIAMHPLKDSGIEARILNFANLENQGTVIGRVSDPSPAIKAISPIPGIALVTVEGLGMAGTPGMAGRLFSALARERVNVLMISQASSEQNICLVIHRDEAPVAQRALLEEFSREIFSKEIDGIVFRTDVCVLALVGEGMAGTPGIAGKVFSLMGANGINIILIAQGSSEYNISFVIDRQNMEEALRILHSELCEPCQ